MKFPEIPDNYIWCEIDYEFYMKLLNSTFHTQSDPICSKPILYLTDEDRKYRSSKVKCFIALPKKEECILHLNIK